MFKVMSAIDIPIVANGQYLYYTIPGDVKMRPIIISGDYTGTYNLDSFLLWSGADNRAIYLDSALNRGTPFDIPLGQLDGWFQSPDTLQFVVSNFALAGNVIVRMWVETVSREEVAPRGVSIKESIELPTRPRWWPPW